jgi:hypothetical protein
MKSFPICDPYSYNNLFINLLGGHVDSQSGVNRSSSHVTNYALIQFIHTM